MAKKISDLTEKNVLNESDSFVISDTVAGKDRRITFSELRKNTSKIIENVSELRQTDGDEHGQIIYLLSRNQKGDGGGGFVYYDEESEEVDNGVTVYGVNGGQPGRWKRPDPGYVDLRWAGAIEGEESSSAFAIIEDDIDEEKIFLPEGKWFAGQRLLKKDYFGRGEVVADWPFFLGSGKLGSLQVDQKNREIEVSRLTSHSIYTTWPQGKVFVCGDELFCFYNQGATHTSANLTVWFQKSSDGVIWTPPKKAYGVYDEDWEYGQTSWSAGCDSNDNIWLIVRKRGDSYLEYDASSQADGTKYLLIKSDDYGESFSVEVDGFGITFNGYVPTEYHDMEQLGDGMMAVGYHFVPGAGEVKVGIMKFDPTDPATIENHDILTDADGYDLGLYVEPTIVFDSETGNTCGFIRSQSNGSNVIFWKSEDNCETFTKEVTDFVIAATIFSVDLSNDGERICCITSVRGQEGGIYYLQADKYDLFEDGASAFNFEILTRFRQAPDINLNATGIGHCASFRDRFWYIMGYDEYGINGEESITGNIFAFSIKDNDQLFKSDLLGSRIPASFSLPRRSIFNPELLALDNVNSMGDVDKAFFSSIGAICMFQFRINDFSPNSAGQVRIRFELPILGSDSTTFLGGTVYRTTGDRDYGTVIAASTGNTQYGILLFDASSGTTASLEVAGYFLL